MSERQETIADIIAEMRVLSNTISDGIIVINGRSIADRFEAAWKREKAAIEADALSAGGLVEAMRQKKATAEKSSAVGDCAKLREALAKARHFIDSSPLVSIEDSTGTTARGELCAEIDAALAAPTRNCDRFATAEEARQAWLDDAGNWDEFGNPKLELHEWLYAPATEKEGGNNANK